MFTNSTDAYQSALKIMGHEYANKYANYWTKKTKLSSLVNQTSKTLVDKRHTMQSSLLLQSIVSYIQTIKNCNSKLKGTEKLFKKIAKSKTYQKLCENQIGSNGGHKNPTLVKQTFVMQPLVKTTWYGAMKLKEHNCPYTVIHEFAHLCGNMHHDIGFRRDVIKLASMFISKEFGNILKRRVSKMLNSRLQLAIIS